MIREKSFIVDGKKFVFDGATINIFSGEKDLKMDFRKGTESNIQRDFYLKTMCLVINNSCNLDCSYCFANKGKYDKPNETMNFDTAKKAIDFLIESVKRRKKNKITIAFFGGEPLLNIDLIKKCVKYIDSHKDIKCNYKITTNGTLLTKDIVEFLIKNKFDIMISIDGNKEKHDFYRKYKNGEGSYNTIKRGISLFEDKSLLNARITITDNNPEICEYIDDILSLGIKRVTFAVDYAISSKAFYLFIESLKKLVKKYYCDILNGKYYDITNFSSIITTIVLHKKKLTFCNAEISYITVSADGKYYRCPRFVGNKNYCLSDVDNNYKAIEKMELFKKRLKNSPGARNLNCKECVYEFICGGMCYHHAVMDGKKEFENVSMECFQRKVLYEEIIRLLCKLSTENRRKLLLFYIKLWSTMKGGK